MVIRVEKTRDFLSEKTIAIIYFSLFLVCGSYVVFGQDSFYIIISHSAKAIIFILVLLNYRNIGKTIVSSKSLWIISCIIFFVINYFLTWSTEGFGREVDSFLGNVFPVILLLFTLKDYNALINKLVAMSRGIGVLAFVVLIFRKTKSYEYSMGFANSMVLPGICLLYDFFRNNKFISLVESAIIAIIIIIMGSRGALFGLTVYFILRMIKDINISKHRLRTVFISIVVAISFIFYDKILELIQEMLAKMDIYSRTIYILINLHGYLSGREGIYKAIFGAFKESPFAIRGVGSSFAITGGAFAHNIVLQFLCEGGLIFGGMATLFIVWNSAKTLAMKSTTTVEELILIFFSASIPRLLFSGSVWSSPELWCWLVLLFFKDKNYGKSFVEHNSSN